MSSDIADSMFAPAALGILASIFIVEVVWDGMKILKKKGENLMGMIFKNFEDKWITKGREQEYKRITEELRKQGIDYTPQHPERMNKK